MTREIEKLTAFDRTRTQIFFSGVIRFECSIEIQNEFKKRKESFDFIERFLFAEKFDSHRWADVNENLRSLEHFHEILIHHQWWEGSRELALRLWEIIGITKSIYVRLRQDQSQKI